MVHIFNPGTNASHVLFQMFHQNKNRRHLLCFNSLIFYTIPFLKVNYSVNNSNLLHKTIHLLSYGFSPLVVKLHVLEKYILL